jgi:Fe-S-cluster-containing dehydrogenase component
MKLLTVNPEKCTGCRLCELACSLRNAGEFNPWLARVQVVGFEEPFCFPIMCFQCTKPYCMTACPVGAITKDEEKGVVKVSHNICIGCKMCTFACPFGNIVFSIKEQTPLKCEFCEGEPECALICPTRAIEFKEEKISMIDKKIELLEQVRIAFEDKKSKDNNVKPLTKIVH